MQERFLWHFPYLERIQGVHGGCEGPLELAALSIATSFAGWPKSQVEMITGPGLGLSPSTSAAA